MGVVQFEKPDLKIVEYRNKRWFIEMKAKKFKHYLAEKGLDEIIQLRKTRGASRKNGREVFSRCLKSPINVGDFTTGNDRVVGLKFEIVADSNPYANRKGNPQSFHLLFDGEPLSGALVQARRLTVADTELQARTDANGRVSLPITNSGIWIVTSVHMVKAAKNIEAFGNLKGPPKQVDADWESFWASTTFEIAARK